MDQSTKNRLIRALNQAILSKAMVVEVDRDDAVTEMTHLDTDLRKTKQQYRASRQIMISEMITLGLFVLAGILDMILQSYMSFAGVAIITPTQFTLSAAVASGILLLLSVSITIIIEIINHAKIKDYIASVVIFAAALYFMIDIWIAVVHLNGIYQLTDMMPWLMH